jgi:hypothetical protein
MEMHDEGEASRAPGEGGDGVQGEVTIDEIGLI